jgi:hypothetical protein
MGSAINSVNPVNVRGLHDLFWRGTAGMNPLHEQRLSFGFHAGQVFRNFDVGGAWLFGLG